ncbi:MAG TPA: putative manganese-dependent inorganic diphosphatase [Thermomicrobiales bacterium]
MSEARTVDSQAPAYSAADVVYVVGHRNPDTDSICSAIAYADLLRRTGTPGAMPARLGPVLAEPAFALERCGAVAPLLIEDVRQRVADVMNHDVLAVHESHTLFEAARLMREGRKGLLPVVDAANHLLGVITVDDIAARYLDDLMVVATSHAPVSLDHFLRVLGGELLVGEPGGLFTGRVWISSSRAETLHARLSPGDLVIVGDREDAQRAAIEGGAACLIVIGETTPSAAVLASARERGTIVITSPQDTYATARLLNLSQPVTEVMRQPPRTVDPEDLAADTATHLLTAPGRALAVVDDERRVRGTISRSDILRGRRKRVILVDHNQRGQAVEGIEEAELLGVIDHHNLGDLHTAEPIPFILEPVGCTATIILEGYERAGLTPSRQIAGLLLAAIISDTLLLTSPTTTPRDRAAIERLAPLAALDPTEFAREMFNARSDFSKTTPRELILGNLKDYEFNGSTLAIGQAETLTTEYFIEHKATFIAELERLKADRGYDYITFLVTDILNGHSLALYPGAGERSLVGSAFSLPDASLSDDTAELPGVVSRKKQVIPPLARALDRR